LVALADIEPDPEKASEEGKAAIAQLQEMALAAGASEEQVANASSWAEVAAMAMGELPQQDEIQAPAVGAVVKFCKRDSKGEKLSGKDKKPFPPQEYTVATVDAAAKTCTLKTKDGKDLVGIGSKKPTVVKWEWLE